MHDNSYLYGEGVEVPMIPQEIIDERVKKLYDHRAKLLEVDLLMRKGVQVNQISKSIDFWLKINTK